MQKIVPHLWYDSDAETAARRYAELIPGSEIGADRALSRGRPRDPRPRARAR